MLTGSGLFQRSGDCLLTWDVPNLQLRSEQGGYYHQDQEQWSVTHVDR